MIYRSSSNLSHIFTGRNFQYINLLRWLLQSHNNIVRMDQITRKISWSSFFSDGHFNPRVLLYNFGLNLFLFGDQLTIYFIRPYRLLYLIVYIFLVVSSAVAKHGRCWWAVVLEALTINRCRTLSMLAAIFRSSIRKEECCCCCCCCSTMHDSSSICWLLPSKERLPSSF